MNIHWDKTFLMCGRVRVGHVARHYWRGYSATLLISQSPTVYHPTQDEARRCIETAFNDWLARLQA